MEIIVASRQLRASHLLDLAYDAGLERPKVATIEEWDGSPGYLLTFGPIAYRRTMTFRPNMTDEKVMELIGQGAPEVATVSTVDLPSALNAPTKPQKQAIDAVKATKAKKVR